MWDGAYKIILAANRKEYPMWRIGFPISNLNGPLPYVRRHITVNKTVPSLLGPTLFLK